MVSKSFVYFVAGRVSITAAEAAAIGLGSQVPSPLFRGCSGGGPNGQSGITVVDKSLGTNPGAAGVKKWIAAPKGDADKPPFWIGFDPDNMPGPDDLKRSTTYPGKVMTLGNGQSWEVPELFQWFEGDNAPLAYDTRLPCMLDMDDHGRPMRGGVVAQYRRIFDLGMRVLMNRHAGANDLTMTDAYQFLVDVLAINYRVSMLELSPSVLDAIRTDEALDLIDVATDAAGFLDIQKKVAGRLIHEDTNSPNGSSRSTPEESPDTAQPAAN